MKVIICGGGQVGYNLARYLDTQRNDVTLIDLRPELVEKAVNALDVKGLVGFASYPSVLERAGAADTDLLIAVTQVDEVNMIACQVAHSLFNVPTKIARVRGQEYLQSSEAKLFGSEDLPVDQVIAPEREVALAIERVLAVPGVFAADSFFGGEAMMLGAICREEAVILGQPLRQLSDLFAELAMTILLVNRSGKRLAVNELESLEVGDSIYFVVPTEKIDRALALLGHGESGAKRRVLIVGGGNIGTQLAQSLEANQPQMRNKLIEFDRERAERVATQLSRTVVLHGDALDGDILKEANVAGVESVVAVTNDDEVNILVCLLARQAGAQRTIAIVNSPTYVGLVEKIGIDAAVDPRAITVSSILQHVRQGRVRAARSLGDGIGELMEMEALDTSSIVGESLREIKMPKGARVAGTLRDGVFTRASGDTQILAGDHVLVFSFTETLRQVEKLFAVQVDYFS